MKNYTIMYLDHGVKGIRTTKADSYEQALKDFKLFFPDRYIINIMESE